MQSPPIKRFTYLFAQQFGQMMGRPGLGWMGTESPMDWRTMGRPGLGWTAMESAMDWRTMVCPGLGWMAMESAMDWRTLGYVMHRAALMPAVVFVLR